MSVIGGISRALFPQALREELLPKAEKMVEAIADGGESGKQKVPSSGGKPGEGSSFFVELVALLLMAVLGIVNTASGATVIFAGSAEHLLPRGLMMLLFSSALGPLVATLTQQGPGRVLIITPDTLVVPFMAKLVTDLASTTDPEQHDVFLTVAMGMALCCASIAASYSTVGLLGIGHLVQHIPAPVMSGYLASVGMLIVDTAVKLQLTCHLKDVGCVVASPTKVPTLIAIAGGFALYYMQRAATGNQKAFVLPAFLVVAIVLLLAIDAIFPNLLSKAWWLPPLPASEPLPWFWPDAHQASFPGGGWLPPRVPWLSLLTHTLSTVIPLTIAALVKQLLLMLGAMKRLELAGDEHFLDGGLVRMGAANAVAAAVGGMGQSMNVGYSFLMVGLGCKSRWPAVSVSASAALVLCTGVGFLKFIPKPVLALFAINVGLGVLLGELRTARSSMSKSEFLLVCLMLATTFVLGDMLISVLLGLLATAILFSFKYSRVAAVSGVHTGEQLRSNVKRPRSQQKVLAASAPQLRVLHLQGYLFFGSVHEVVHGVDAFLNTAARARDLPHCLVLDCAKVVAADASASAGIGDLQKRCDAMKNVHLFISHATPKVLRAFTAAGFKRAFASGASNVFSNLDYTLEQCEEVLLRNTKSERLKPPQPPMLRASPLKQGERRLVLAQHKATALTNEVEIREWMLICAREAHGDLGACLADIWPLMDYVSAAPETDLPLDDVKGPFLYVVLAGCAHMWLSNEDGEQHRAFFAANNDTAPQGRHMFVRLSKGGAGTIFGGLSVTSHFSRRAMHLSTDEELHAARLRMCDLGSAPAPAQVELLKLLLQVTGYALMDRNVRIAAAESLDIFNTAALEEEARREAMADSRMRRTQTVIENWGNRQARWLDLGHGYSKAAASSSSGSGSTDYNEKKMLARSESYAIGSLKNLRERRSSFYATAVTPAADSEQ